MRADLTLYNINRNNTFFFFTFANQNQLVISPFLRWSECGCLKFRSTSISFTFIVTGYIVPPISKLPFLNIMTDVLLMQVPVINRRGQMLSHHKTTITRFTSRAQHTLTFRKYQDGKFDLSCNVSSQPADRGTAFH